MRRITNSLQTHLLNSKNIFKNFLTVGPSNCDFSDLNLALENSLPNQEFFIFGGHHQGTFNLKDGQKFHLFFNPVFIAPIGQPLFNALFFNNSQNVTVHFFGRGSFIFSDPNLASYSQPNVNNFIIHLDLFVQCTISQAGEAHPTVNIFNSNVSYHSPIPASRDNVGVYLFYLLPLSHLGFSSSFAIEGASRFPLVSRVEEPHILKLLIFDKFLNPSDDFLLDLTISTKSIVNFT